MIRILLGVACVFGVLCQKYDIPQDSFASSTIVFLRLLHDENDILTLFKDTFYTQIDNTDYRHQEISKLLKNVERVASLKPTNLTAEYLEDFYGHPINAFHVINVWAAVFNFMEREGNYPPVVDVKDQMQKKDYRIPTNIDLKGMIHCVLRLQSVYDLTTHNLAMGVIKGYRSLEPLTAHACYKIGLVAYESMMYSLATQWMEEATNDWQTYQSLLPNEKRDVHYVLYSIFKNEGALDKAEEELEESHLSNTNDEFVFQELRRFKLQKYADNVETNTLALPDPDPANYDMYKRLCQAPIIRNITSKRGFQHGFCRYTGMYDYYKYKQEVFNINPWVSFFHDAISEDDIQFMKDFAKTKLERSIVVADKDLFFVRTSSTAWIFDEFAPRIRQLSLKVQAMTELHINTIGSDHWVWRESPSAAEAFQVLNYGFGGHYIPHVDLLGDDVIDVVNLGNRMATFMFYLTDVKEGGATVFTKLGIRIPPKKGGAAFWFNMNKAGEAFPDTEHAGCPVLVGHKWVANKWVRSKGQIAARPCGLSSDTKESFII